MLKKLPVTCPSCNSKLKVKSLICKDCETVIEGIYELPLLALMNNKEQEFIISFIKHSGSLKEMAKEMNLSYPTVRNLLDDIIANVKSTEANLKNNNINNQ